MIENEPLSEREKTAIATINSQDHYLKALKYRIPIVDKMGRILDQAQKQKLAREGVLFTNPKSKRQYVFDDQFVEACKGGTKGMYEELSSTYVELDGGELIKVETPKMKLKADIILEGIRENT